MSVHVRPVGARHPRAVLHAVVAAASIAAALLAARPAALAAQSQPDARPVPSWERRSAPTFSVGGAGLFTGERRGGGGTLEAGGGFDVHAAVGISSFALAVGYQRATYPIGGTDANATLGGVFVEPRVAVGAFRNYTPYLAGRVAFLGLDAPATGAFTATDASRTQYGGGAGVLVSLAPNVSLDLGAMYTWISGAENAAIQPNAPFRGGRGGAPMLRAGVVLGFDRWGK